MVAPSFPVRKQPPSPLFLKTRSQFCSPDWPEIQTLSFTASQMLGGITEGSYARIILQNIYISLTWSNFSLVDISTDLPWQAKGSVGPLI